jgi:hypothetical protein
MQRIALFGLRIVPFVTPKRAAAMSALGQKQTLIEAVGMLALCQKRTLRAAAICAYRYCKNWRIFASS